MLLLLVLAFALSGHWLACLWYAIGLNGSCDKGIPINSSWINTFTYEQGRDPFEFDANCVLTKSPDSGNRFIILLIISNQLFFVKQPRRISSEIIRSSPVLYHDIIDVSWFW